VEYRPLGRTGWKVSEVSFGAWAIGGAWGHVSDEEAMAALRTAVDCGVNFFDTADVYGNGRSERLIGELKKNYKKDIIVATKAGRRLPSQSVAGYSAANPPRGWTIACAISRRMHSTCCSSTARRPSSISSRKLSIFWIVW